VDQVNVVSIEDDKGAQIFKSPCQEYPKHQSVSTIDSKIYDEVQAQDDSHEYPKDNLITIEQEPEAVQAAPP